MKERMPQAPADLAARLRRIRPRQALSLTAVVLLAALTIWTMIEAVLDFPLRWAGYLVLFCWLASGWSALSLSQWKTGLTAFLLFCSVVLSLAGLPVVMLAFSAD